MAYYNEKQRKIILSVEDEETFKEAAKNVQMKTTPVANSIMRRILPKEYRTQYEK
jgi:hypothetical protein